MTLANSTMRRLDWRLLKPRHEGDKSAAAIAQNLDKLLANAVATGLAEVQMRALSGLEQKFEAVTVSTCDAVDAPRVDQDPDWQTRIVDEYGETEIDLELEDYLNLRSSDPDCERCPYASPYSLYPMDPCEFSAGMLELILLDSSLWQKAQQQMTPEKMLAYANELETALHAKRWREVEVLDSPDYLAKAIFFLRFWAGQGFWVRPDDLDVTLAPHEERQATHTEDEARGNTSLEDGSDDEPTYH